MRNALFENLTMTRYCIVCATPIAAERIAKNPKKVKFCGDMCRSKDRHEVSELQSRKKRSKLKKPTCASTFPYEPLEPSVAHVHEQSEATQ